MTTVLHGPVDGRSTRPFFGRYRPESQESGLPAYFDKQHKSQKCEFSNTRHLHKHNYFFKNHTNQAIKHASREKFCYTRGKSNKTTRTKRKLVKATTHGRGIYRQLRSKTIVHLSFITYANRNLILTSIKINVHSLIANSKDRG